MIARELLVKLGFDIDETKFSRFIKMSDDLKSRMTGLKNSVATRLNAEAIQPNNSFTKKFAQAKAYADELKALTPAERSEIKLLNKLESDEIKERLREVKTRQQERRKASLAKVGTLANKIAVISAAATGIFALNTRSTLKDVEQFKKTGTTDSGNTFSKDQVKTVDNFNRSLKSLKYTSKEIRNSFIIDLLPPLNEVIIEFRGWIESNKELIRTKLKGVISGVSQAFSFLLPVLKRLFDILNAIIEPTLGWKNLITALIGIGLIAWIAGVTTKVWGLVASFWALVANPVGLTIAAIAAALVLLADEIYMTIQGGDTLINRFLDTPVWKGFKKNLDAIIDSFRLLWTLTIKTTEAIGDMVTAGLDKISFKNILPDFSGIGEMVGNREINVPIGGKLINMKDRLPKYNPQEAFGNSNSVMNTTNRNNKVLNQRNSFNINVTTPVGTSQEQSRIIVDLVQKELQKTFDYENEKALIAIGVHS
jgi:hypothetical protein